MRAIYNPNLFSSDERSFCIRGEDAFHLIRVVRIRVGERVLFMNGKGGACQGTVEALTKSEVSGHFELPTQGQRAYQIDVAGAILKKEAMEDMIRQTVELGIRTFIPTRTAFSQADFHCTDRVDRILDSAMKQSNNLFLPEISPLSDLRLLPFSNYDHIAFFNEHPCTTTEFPEFSTTRSVLVLIGPEGGFSMEEVAWIRELPRVHTIHLPSPILRAPTAMAVALGQLMARIR